MKKFVSSILIMVALAGSVAASAAEGEGRPPGVAAHQWIAITERLGFVAIDKQEPVQTLGTSRQLLIAPPEKVSADLMPPRKGYFVVKTQTGWQRLALSDPAELTETSR